jgi:hypothetical protein
MLANNNGAPRVHRLHIQSSILQLSVDMSAAQKAWHNRAC